MLVSTLICGRHLLTLSAPPRKGPEEVVTDYLTKAFECFDASTEYIVDLKPTMPVDIVITTPVVCLTILRTLIQG
jgi:hypothetical protein